MNTDTINLVQRSFAQVRPNAGVAADLFDRRLFELDPDLRSLLISDIGEQGARLMTMIGLAVDGLDDLDTLIAAVRAAVPGIEATASSRSTTTWWRSPALDVDKGLGDASTPDVRVAWAETHGLLASVMKDAAYE